MVVTVQVPDLSGATEQMDAELLAQRLDEKARELRNDPSLTEEEREQRLKEEKLRIGIEKMKLAHKKRVAIKVFNPDHSNKTVVVQEGMTASMVCHLLVVKNHFDESPNWVLVEQLGDVSLERELEDHEDVVEVYSSWPREHNNLLLFKQNEKKYDLFEDPIVSSGISSLSCCNNNSYRNIFLTTCVPLKQQTQKWAHSNVRKRHVKFYCRNTSLQLHGFLSWKVFST